MSLPDEIQKRVQEDEQKEDAQKQKVKRFDPRKVLAGGIRTIEDEELGAISFGELSIGDVFELNKTVKDEQEKGLGIIWLMLKKACPELKFDEVKAYPQNVAVRLLTVLGEQSSFLQSKPKT